MIIDKKRLFKTHKASYSFSKSTVRSKSKRSHSNNSNFPDISLNQKENSIMTKKPKLFKKLKDDRNKMMFELVNLSQKVCREMTKDKYKEVGDSELLSVVFKFLEDNFKDVKSFSSVISILKDYVYSKHKNPYFDFKKARELVCCIKQQEKDETYINKLGNDPKLKSNFENYLKNKVFGLNLPLNKERVKKNTSNSKNDMCFEMKIPYKDSLTKLELENQRLKKKHRKYKDLYTELSEEYIRLKRFSLQIENNPINKDLFGNLIQLKELRREKFEILQGFLSNYIDKKELRSKQDEILNNNENLKFDHRNIKNKYEKLLKAFKKQSDVLDEVLKQKEDQEEKIISLKQDYSKNLLNYNINIIHIKENLLFLKNKFNEKEEQKSNLIINTQKQFINYIENDYAKSLNESVILKTKIKKSKKKLKNKKMVAKPSIDIESDDKSSLNNGYLTYLIPDIKKINPNTLLNLSKKLNTTIEMQKNDICGTNVSLVNDTKISNEVIAIFNDIEYTISKLKKGIEKEQEKINSNGI